MGVAFDIFRTWRHPRKVMRDRLAGGVREDRALAYLMIACAMIFVGQWPALVRDAQQNVEVGQEARLAATLFAWLFVVPLAMYFVAAVSHVIAKLVGGQGGWFSARMALFWSLLAAAPVWVLNGLIASATDSQILLAASGATAFFLFMAIWISSMLEAERKERA